MIEQATLQNLEKELLDLPEVQQMLEEKLTSLRKDVSEQKMSLAIVVKALTMAYKGIEQFLRIEVCSLRTRRNLDPLEREIKRIERYTAPRAGAIDDDAIERARRYPLDQLIKTPLRGYGRRRMCSCPFHEEKTASMVVYTDQNSYHCYGCGANGNAIDYVMASEGLTFIEAVKRLQ
jgi:hypothetical protein